MSPEDPQVLADTPDTTVRPPQQARSRRTLERLEKAALELVARDGPDSVTVAQVVARARSSVGSFYARFQGKDELFLHLAEGLRREALERWEALDVAAGPDPVAATVGFLVEDEREGGGRRRALLAHGDSGEDGGEFSRIVAADLHGALAGSEDEGPTLEAVSLAIRMVRASLAALVSGSGGVAADGGELVDPSTLPSLLEEVVRVVLVGAVEGATGRGATVIPAPAPVPDEFREPVEMAAGGADAGEGEAGAAAADEEAAAERSATEPPSEVGVSEAPLQDESPRVDPFDVWG